MMIQVQHYKTAVCIICITLLHFATVFLFIFLLPDDENNILEILFPPLETSCPNTEQC